MRSNGMRLILFDIDGTLLSCGAQIRPLFAAALAEVFGADPLLAPGVLEDALNRHDFAGKTDSRSVLELMVGAGRDEREVRSALPAMRDAFARHLDRGLRREEMELMPRVVELLEELRRRDHLSLALLTGNWEPSGRIKLSRFDLNRYFAFGAFGEDAEDRPDLVPVVLERAARLTGETLGPEDALIIGDTCRDVECGRAHGVATLAVATGDTPAEELRAAGADWVIEDLGRAAEVVPGL
jgi:phosphoglycolate phosphatase